MRSENCLLRGIVREVLGEKLVCRVRQEIEAGTEKDEQKHQQQAYFKPGSTSRNVGITIRATADAMVKLFAALVATVVRQIQAREIFGCLHAWQLAHLEPVWQKTVSPLLKTIFYGCLQVFMALLTL